MKKKENESMNKMVVIGLFSIVILLLLVILVVIIKDDDNKLLNNYPNDKEVNDRFDDEDKYDDRDEDEIINNSNKNYISRDKALSIVFKNLGVKQTDVHDLDIDLEYKYGQVVYEIDFDYNYHEYEYYVNAETGKIVHSFKERD